MSEIVPGFCVIAGAAAASPEHRAAIQGALRMWGEAAGRPAPAPPRQPGKESRMRTFRVTVDGHPYEVTVDEMPDAMPRPAPPRRAAASVPDAEPIGVQQVRAPIPGKILDVRVAVGGRVARGDVLLVLEAMKMENDILAPAGGRVSALQVRPGDAVNAGDLLVALE
jgi:biotin carboxyl carrier protein